MSTQFAVSIIVPVYNAATTVRRAVESAWELDEVGEILLIDDAGPDNAIDICRQLEQEHHKVRLLRHPDGKNHGAGASRNLGIAHAKYNFIAFLDADDYYLPDRFRAEREIMPQDPSIDGVYGATSIEYETESARLRFHAAGLAEQEFETMNGRVPPEELFSVLFHQNPRFCGSFHTDAITVRSSFFRVVGLFDVRLRLQQDTHLWCRLAAVGRLQSGIIDRPVAVRGIHDRNRMTDNTEQAKYTNLWWESLREEFSKLRVSHQNMNIFHKAYTRHLIDAGRSLRAAVSLVRTLAGTPGCILNQYGFFDMCVMDLCRMSRVAIKLLSVKNRISRNLRKCRMLSIRPHCDSN